MRFAHSVVAVCILLLAVPSWGKQPPQSSSTSQSTSDPQAVALVQSAITALGGATAIGQSQQWDVQAQLNGPLVSESPAETIMLNPPIPSVVVNGVSRPAPRYVTQSQTLPVLVGAILLEESQDTNFVMRYDGPSTLASTPVTGVTFLWANSYLVAQTWLFNAATGLPARVSFDSPAQLGLSKSIRGIVDLSNYTSVSGILYPFSVVTYTKGRMPETLTLQSVTPSASSSTSQTGSNGGGAL